MKIETQIAEGNIKELVLWREGYGLDGRKLDRKGYSKNLDFELISLSKQGEHRASCQRFLEFLEDYVKGLDAVPVKISVKHKDLKQAIKLYDEAGI